MINPAEFGRIDPKDWRELDDHYTQPIWPDKLPSNPTDYGSNGFHGRTHPEIIRVALQRYTQPGDVVWDPMAGSGTTIDVCTEFGNECVATDILPTRSDIIQADAKEWNPDEKVDLVVLHPPYLDIIEWEHEESLAVDDVDAWLDMMDKVISNVTASLKICHVLVLILGQVYKEREVIPLDCLTYPLLCNYRLLGRVMRGFGETQGGATAGKKRENLWKFRRLKYGIWGLGIDTVMFLQRIS